MYGTKYKKFIVVFFACLIFIGINKGYGFKQNMKETITDITWKLEEETDLNGNVIQSYENNLKESIIVLKFSEDKTFVLKNQKNGVIEKGTYDLKETESKGTYMIHFISDSGKTSYYGVYGIRKNNKKVIKTTVRITTKTKIMSFLEE